MKVDVTKEYQSMSHNMRDGHFCHMALHIREHLFHYSNPGFVWKE